VVLVLLVLLGSRVLDIHFEIWVLVSCLGEHPLKDIFYIFAFTLAILIFRQNSNFMIGDLD
jgi:hypothetical protein